LLKAGLFDGAYYLAGYAVECALKACIAKDTQRGEFPNKKRVDQSHSHNVAELIKVAGLDETRIEHAIGDAAFRTNWETGKAWSELSRYERHGAESARGLVAAVVDRRHGVISWIKLRW
jgi:hypothetical protein